MTDRDRVVAELVPPPGPPLDRSHGAFVAAGVEGGWLKPATRRGPLPDRGPPPSGDPAITFERLIDDLDRDREDR